MSDEDYELERLKAKRLAEMQRNISATKNQKEQLYQQPQQQPQQQLPQSGSTDVGNTASSQQRNDTVTTTTTNTPTPRQILINHLGYRGSEVLQNAESQFPQHTPFVIQQLVQLIGTGEINTPLDGGQLLALFRAIGLAVKMDNKIHVQKDGKLVSLSDKLLDSSSNKPIKDDDNDTGERLS